MALSKSSFLIKGRDLLHPVNKIKKFFGLKNHIVDVIIDASGFAYSDQWGTKPIKYGLYRNKRYKSAFKVLMPQALGPFENNLNIR